MNVYTMSETELRAHLLTEPCAVLSACLVPSVYDDVTGLLVPPRCDVVLSEAEIVAAARQSPRAGLSAAGHCLPKEVLSELAELDPWAAIYFCASRLDTIQRAMLEGRLKRESAERDVASEARQSRKMGVQE